MLIMHDATQALSFPGSPRPVVSTPTPEPGTLRTLCSPCLLQPQRLLPCDSAGPCAQSLRVHHTGQASPRTSHVHRSSLSPSLPCQEPGCTRVRHCPQCSLALLGKLIFTASGRQAETTSAGIWLSLLFLGNNYQL